MMDRLAAGLFQRFGDGPVYSQVQCTSSIDQSTNGAILPGAFIKVRLNTFPNPATLARGSTRVMQVLRRDITPTGRGFLLLDAGSNLSPLATPTVSLALSTQSSRHVIKGTVASLAAAARYEAQVAKASTGTTSPAGLAWFTAAFGSSTGLTWTLGSQPSRTKFFGRARAMMPNRIGSGWSTATVSVVTASIAAPTGLTVSGITAGGATLVFTPGSTLYPIEVMVDASSVATLTAANVVAIVPPATTRHVLAGLNSNDSHKVGVRHRDNFGGRSLQDTTTFTTTTGYAVAPALRGIVIIQGAL